MDMTYNDTAFFAATEIGIYYADKNSPNLAYFGNWKTLDNLPYPAGNYNHVHSHKGSLLINYNDANAEADELFVLNNGEWVLLDDEAGSRTKSIRTTQGNLVVSYIYNVTQYDDELNRVLKIYTYSNEATPNSEDAIMDEQGEFWVGDRSKSLVNVFAGGWESNYIRPDGAPTSDIYRMATGSGHLWLVPGGMSGTWGNIWRGAQVYSFIEESWSGYNQYNTGGLDTIRDMVGVGVNPFNISQVFAGSWSRGLLEFNEGVLTNIYNEDNSSLMIHELEGSPVLKVGGVDFDSDGNAWFSNSGAENILSMRRNDGTTNGDWTSYHLGAASIGIYVRELVVDTYDQKWMLCRVTASNPANPYYFLMKRNL
jgi:hypothetical protein